MTIKRIITGILASIMLLVLLLNLTGCRGRNSEAECKAKSVALVLGAHKNSMDLNLNSDVVSDSVSDAISSFGLVSIILNDGNPEMIFGKRYKVKEQYRGNPNLLKQLSEKEAKNVLKDMDDIRANDAEVDTLEAIRLAARTLSSAPKNSEKIIVVADTGLSTTGILNFQNNIINADSEEIAEQLDEKDAIPNLEDIKVIWQQIGDVYDPQQSLTPAQVKNLKKIWKAIIEKGGGKFESVDIVSNQTSISESLPNVTTINLPAETAIKFEPENIKDFTKPQFLGEEHIKFIGDSDKYIDPNAAKEALKPIAKYMNENNKFKMLLIGTTAGDENSDLMIDLSEKRAKAVKSSLVSMGVPEKNISYIGLGCSDPWHIYNVGTGGGLASNNRKVVLIDASSDIAKSLNY